MASVADLVGKINKHYKADIGKMGLADYVEGGRLPTGIFALDLATGGGFPIGRPSIVFGAESSCKTNICLLAIAEAQRKWPTKKCVFIDVEGHFDPAWAKQLGVDTEALVHILPDYAEQVVDIVEQLITADDIAVIVVDSLAAMIGSVELKNSAEVAVVGGTGLVVGKLYRKVGRTLTYVRTHMNRVPPAVLMINQIRQKVGGPPGQNPETMPGGNAWKFGSCLTLRLYGKDVVVKDLHPNKPSVKAVSVIVKKAKCETLARSCEFQMSMLNLPDKGIKVGDTNEWATFKTYATSQGMLAKGQKGGWQLFNFDDDGTFSEFKTLEQAETKFDSDLDYRARAKAGLVKRMLSSGAIIEGEDKG